MKRVHYFNGQLLSAEDFQVEQDYHLARQRRHNLIAHGVGIVSGLQVSVRSDGIHISPGVAIDGYGNEIVVGESQRLPFPPGHSCVDLAISYAESLTDLVPAGDRDALQPSRIEEGFKFEYLDERGIRDEKQIRLIRLVRRAGRWDTEKNCASAVLTWGLVILGLAFVSHLFSRRRS